MVIGVEMDQFAVTPFTGVWIEIFQRLGNRHVGQSHPSRVCGLKYYLSDIVRRGNLVTPFTGVWIEIRPLYG